MKHLAFALILLSVLTARPAFASHVQAQTNLLLFPEQKVSIELPSEERAGGFSLAAGDLGSDEIPELLVGSGMGSEPRVRVLRLDGSEIGHFLAYDASLRTGIQVTTCDVDGDGYNEIITAPQRGGGPNLRLFDRFGKMIGAEWMAYSQDFKGGVNLACGNLFGDARDELVTLPGTGGGPHVRVWSFENQQWKLQKEFFAFDTQDRSGLVGSIAQQQLFLVQQKTSSPIIKTFSLETNEPTWIDERGFSISATGVASIVIHNQQRVISTTSNGLMYNVDEETKEKISETHGSFALASTNLDEDSFDELLAVETKIPYDTTNETRIVVDVSEQRLWAYQEGILENSFLISSGKNKATPVGKHQILAKIPKVHYRWTYGPNDPRNYDLGLVPYNLRFAPHIYLHYAYWHNNFGHPMSRGCVNVSLSNMKWLYDWADVGIQVEVKE